MAMMLWFLKAICFLEILTFWQPKKVTCPTQNNGAMNCQKFFRTLSFLRGSEAYCKAHPQEDTAAKTVDLSSQTCHKELRWQGYCHRITEN